MPPIHGVVLSLMQRDMDRMHRHMTAVVGEMERMQRTLHRMHRRLVPETTP